MIAVPDDERERCPERAPVAKTGEHLDFVLFDPLARAAAVALLAAVEVAVDRVLVEHETGGQARDDRDQSGPVRLPRRDELHGHPAERTAARITSIGAGTPVQRSKEAAPCRTSASSPSITTSHPAARAARTSAVSDPSAL